MQLVDDGVETLCAIAEKYAVPPSLFILEVLEGLAMANADALERLRVVLEETLAMARRLRIRTVVEGVETETGDRIVHALGADRAQGYFYGCPMDAQALRERFLSAG